MVPTQEQIDELKAKHGDKLHAVDFDDPVEATILFKRPSKAVWGRYVDNVSRDTESKTRLGTELVESCVVFPEEAELKQLLADAPGLVLSIVGAISDASGLVQKKPRRL